MLDIQDRFVNWLMTGFYDNLKREVEGYGLQLVKAIDENDTGNIDFYLKMIKETREILDDLSDENMEIGDFVSLVLGKYIRVSFR